MRKGLCRSRGAAYFAALALLLTGRSASAADPQANSPTAKSADVDGSANNIEGPLSRWLQINTFSFAARYRGVSDTEGVRSDSQGQQRSLLDGKVKLDEKGKYSIGFHLSSGHYFDWAYADFAGGGAEEGNAKSIAGLPLADKLDALSSGTLANNYPSGGWAFLPRQLYFDAKPIDGVELQYGSLGINRGVNTEITSYDDDGYIDGGRLIIRKPQYLYFDEVSVTYAYLGDILTPNFFERGNRLTQSNYHQFLVRKKLMPWLDVSADYTWNIAHTMREAAYVKTKKMKVVDGVRFEAYQRFNGVFADTEYFASGSGFAVSAERTIRKRYNVQAGFANIDTNYDVYAANRNNSIYGFALNGDQYGMGKRPFVRANVKLTPYLSMFGFYTHLVSFDYARDGFIWNAAALNAGLQIDFKPLLKLGK